jgi:hypothetical protein
VRFDHPANIRGQIRSGRQWMARRATVRITTEMLLIVGNSCSPHCPVCGSRMVTLEQGRMLCGVAIDRLNGWLQSGAVHHSDPTSFQHLLCLHSMLICHENENPA